MKKYLIEYINNNLKSIIILFFCLILGIIIGIFLYQLLDIDTKGEFSNTITSTLNLSKQENFEGINLIKNGIFSNGILIFCIYLTSITLIAPLLVCFFNIFKGFAIGIYISTLFQIFGASKGILAVLIIVIIPNIIYLPAYIYICINAISFHYKIINEKIKSNIISIFLKELYQLIIGFGVIFLSLIIEQILSGSIISIYKSII